MQRNPALHIHAAPPHKYDGLYATGERRWRLRQLLSVNGTSGAHGAKPDEAERDDGKKLIGQSEKRPETVDSA